MFRIVDSPKKPGAKDGQIGLSREIITHGIKISLMIYSNQLKNL